MKAEDALKLPSFGDVLTKLHEEGHTGPVLLHYAGGAPRSIEILTPSLRIVLDNERRHGKLDASL
jgi:hypothetical protein